MLYGIFTLYIDPRKSLPYLAFGVGTRKRNKGFTCDIDTSQ